MLERKRRADSEVNKTDDGVEMVRIFAVMLDKTSPRQSYNEDGVITVLEENEVTLHLVGVNMDKISKIKFTTIKNTYGGPCRDSSEAHFQSQELSVEREENHPGFATVLLPGLIYHPADYAYYLCVKEEGSEQFVHQGGDKQLLIEMTSSLLPVWLMVVLRGVMLVLSGLFSGINLGLVSLDQTDLRVVM